MNNKCLFQDSFQIHGLTLCEARMGVTLEQHRAVTGGYKSRLSSRCWSVTSSWRVKGRKKRWREAGDEWWWRTRTAADTVDFWTSVVSLLLWTVLLYHLALTAFTLWKSVDQDRSPHFTGLGPADDHFGLLPLLNPLSHSVHPDVVTPVTQQIIR